MDKVLFEETQRNTILIVAITLVAVAFGVLSVVQIGFHHPIGNHPAPGWLLLLFFAGSIAGGVFFNSQKLKLIITENEIHVSLGLLTSKTVILKENIKSINMRKYSALKEFMGWGVRYNDRESCFTVSGNDAIEIEMTNNEKILIGTHMPEQMRVIIDKYLSFQ